MDIQILKIDKETAVKVIGRIDTNTSPELEKSLNEITEQVEHLIIDFEEVSYISSAGLRVLLAVHKKMAAKKGSMVIKQVNESVMEVLEVTGFDSILTIEA